MRVMLHGAVNQSNYGDYLFAELFFHKLKEKGAKVEFYTHPKYGICEHFATNLGYVPESCSYKNTVKKCDVFVFFSGGYFIEPRKKGIAAEIKRIRQYLYPALAFMKAGKPIYVLGVGAGPFENAPYSNLARKILNYANIITVRNEESLQYCKDFGINKEIIITADTALVIKEYLDLEKQSVPKFEIEEGKRMLLFHIDGSKQKTEKMKESIIPATKKWLKVHPEYQLYLTADRVSYESLYQAYEELFIENNPIILKYDDPWKLTRQIERADLVITTKLHVGIVGSALGRSVVSFPSVPNKTLRFYKQIGEADRCVPLETITMEKAYKMLDTYNGRGIIVPKELIDKAKINLELLP